MPPEMVVNPVTGFLDRGNENSFSTFSSDKKLKFLELADNYRREQGKWPNLDSICDAIGIHITTFYNHLSADSAFKRAWEERLLRGEAVLTSKLADMKNPIGPLSVLRRYFPQRWNPEYKVTVQNNGAALSSMANDVDNILEGEIVPDKQISDGK